MRLRDEDSGEVLVAGDQAERAIEVRFEQGAAGGVRVVRLSPEEARHLASLILFNASRLERRRPAWPAPLPMQVLRSA